MSDIRQSEEYARFMEKLGWKFENIKCQITNDKLLVYIKEFPIIGSFIKILRPNVIPTLRDLEVLKKYRPFKIQIEPNISNISKSVTSVTREYKRLAFKATTDSLIPSKTILIDLKPPEEKIFSYFSEEKRRAVRRAIKNKIVVSKSNNIEDFIKLKNQQLWPFGFLLTGEIKKLWEIFKPKSKTKLLLAYPSVSLRAPLSGAWQSHYWISRLLRRFAPRNDNVDRIPVAGVLLLFYNNTSHYWLASSLKEGNRLYAPTLLVWEAIKLSQELGYKIFDFEGIEDERFPKTKSWRGFSKFKKGFGGREISYCEPFQKLFLPIL